jgi:histone H3/H4
MAVKGKYGQVIGTDTSVSTVPDKKTSQKGRYGQLVSESDIIKSYKDDVVVPIFSTKGIEEELARRKQDTGFEKGIKEFIGGTAFDGGKIYEENVPGWAKYGARMMGEVGDIVGGMGDIAGAVKSGQIGAGDIPGILKEMPGAIGTSVGTTARHPVQSMQNRPITSLMDAFIARAASKGVAQGVSKVAASKAGQAVAKRAGGAAAGGVSLTTGVEPELAQRAIIRTGQVFTKENRAIDAYARVGRVVQQNVDDVGKEYGKAVAEESRALSKIPGRVTVYNDDMQNALNTIKSSRLYPAKDPVTGKFVQRGISSDDLQKIGQYEEMLKMPQTPRTLHKIKLEMDEMLKAVYRDYGKAVSPPSDVMEKSMGVMRRAINENLKSASPGYREANLRSSKLFEAERALGPEKLNRKDIGQGLKSIINDPAKRAEWMPALELLDDALPANKKFLDKLMDVHTAQKFNKLTRHKIPDIAVGGGLAYGAMTQPGLAAGIALGTSPKATAYGLKGLQMGSEGVKRAGKHLADMPLVPEVPAMFKNLVKGTANDPVFRNQKGFASLGGKPPEVKAKGIK